MAARRSLKRPRLSSSVSFDDWERQWDKGTPNWHRDQVDTVLIVS